jgi:hypothetical protein
MGNGTEGGYRAAETFFGVTGSNRGYDIKSLYAAEVRRPPETLVGTVDLWGRPPSFDVSNNVIMCSCGLEGLPSEVAIVRGLHSAVGEELPGVYVHKELLRLHTGFRFLSPSPGRGAAAWRQTALAGGLFPTATYHFGPVELVTTTFAPLAPAPEGSPRALVVMLRLSNEDAAATTLELQVETGYDPPAAPPHPADVGRAAVRVVSLSQELLPGAANVFTGAVPGHGQACWSVAICVDEDEGDLDRTEAIVRTRDPQEWLDATGHLVREHLGDLAIPSETYYSGLLVRQVELCRQSLAYSNQGAFAAGFWGSDVNDWPHVWMRDNFYSALALAWFAPKLCADASLFFAEQGAPARAWGRGVGRFSPLTAPLHSIGNAVAAVVLAGAYLRATGDAPWLRQARQPYDYGTSLFDEVAGSPWGKEDLLPSLYISDGDARGDWHTGSNILVWRALMDLADMAGQVMGDQESARRWRGWAARVRAAVLDNCAGEALGGRRLFEGANRDGGLIAGHDGEESDLTLASYYGFTGPDDPLVARHAQAAFSPENPLYWAPIDGVQWWDTGVCWGPTFPAYVHRLAGAENEDELRAVLEHLRSLADVDGSFWWWPYKPFRHDRAAVERGPGKTGWAAGVFVCRMVKDVLGVDINALNGTVRLRPFSPWGYEWDNCRLGTAALDITYGRSKAGRSIGVCNRGEYKLDITNELIGPAAAMPTTVVVNGAVALESYGVGWAFGRRTVRATMSVEPGQRFDLECSWPS